MMPCQPFHEGSYQINKTNGKSPLLEASRPKPSTHLIEEKLKYLQLAITRLHISNLIIYPPLPKGCNQTDLTISHLAGNL